MANSVTRKRRGRGFAYYLDNGRLIRSKALRTWIASLAIPPAWHDVEIDVNRSAKVHAVGRDEKGRKQYIYNSQWSERASEEKFQRILRFASQLETMRRVTGQHLIQRPINEKTVLACMTRMMDEAFFRPGNRRYTAKNKTHGLTTLRAKHMRLASGKVEFDYIGKGNKKQHREIHDRRVYKVLSELEQMPGYQLFDVTLPEGERRAFSAADLNQYIADVMGEDFSAKDFRTWAGTVLMAAALNEVGPVKNKKLSTSNVVAAVKSVAEKLGNTPAICRSSYIHPQIILQYESGRTLNYFKQQIKRLQRKYISFDEYATLQLLQYAIKHSKPSLRKSA